MRRFQAAALATLILAGMTPGAYAQTATTPAAPVTTTDNAVVTDRVSEDDDGFDLGWLGIFGLFGLFGLRGRKHDISHVSATSRTH